MKLIQSLGLALLSVVYGAGVLRAYSRGGNDFEVFYHAWQLVVKGAGAQIYTDSPDRFLYCPGFAWLLAPLGLLPFSVSLGVWCVAKLGVLAFLIRRLSVSGGTLGLAVWGVLMMARPLLIDLEYGQVNLLILGVCVWSILTHFQKDGRLLADFTSWCLLGCVAIAKVFPLPLILLPWVVTKNTSVKKLWIERLALGIGILLGLFLPVVTEGGAVAIQLLQAWKWALVSKGLPLESHNQSFSAFLHHYLGGYPTRVLAEGATPLFYGVPLFSGHTIALLSYAWTFLMMGILLGWIVVGSTEIKSTGMSSNRWLSIIVGLLIVPSYLVWKPYFVMGIPLGIYLIQWLFQRFSQGTVSRYLAWKCILIVGFFLGMNFTGFDFLGHRCAAYLEAGSLMLMIHLGMIMTAASSQPSLGPSPQSPFGV